MQEFVPTMALFLHFAISYSLFFVFLHHQTNHKMTRHILIADSGSTKTDWALTPSIVNTQGLNPIHQSRDTILQILRSELLPQIDVNDVNEIYFYGSGVRPELEPVMEHLLREVFPKAETIEAHSDMLGAARAVCGRNEGISSILGTGANSCLYDGKKIVDNTPALGYILGDEGSGAVLGRRFLNALYKGFLSKEIKDSFEEETDLTMAVVIERVYRQPLANRFLASLSEFIHRHLDDEAVHQLVVGNFDDFFQKNIVPYNRRDLPVSFVGSIAWYYRPQLQESAERQGFRIGTILKSPIEGLLHFHQ